MKTWHGPRRKYSLSIVGKACLQCRCIATEVTRLLLAYSLPRECVYRVVAWQWTSILTSLFRLSVVISQYTPRWWRWPTLSCYYVNKSQNAWNNKGPLKWKTIPLQRLPVCPLRTRKWWRRIRWKAVELLWGMNECVTEWQSRSGTSGWHCCWEPGVC
jgi:hypothetical protein